MTVQREAPRPAHRLTENPDLELLNQPAEIAVLIRRLPLSEAEKLIRSLIDVAVSHGRIEGMTEIRDAFAKRGVL